MGVSLGCSGGLRGEKEAEREGRSCCPEKTNGVSPSLIIASSGRKASKLQRETRRGCGKKMGSRRLVEVAGICIPKFCQKVFDDGLGKLIISTCHETPLGEVSHIIRAFHPF